MGAARTVLMIAFQFPPFAGSSAVQRTLRFAQYLPRFGWKPVVLTVHPRAYEKALAVKGNEIPPGVEVHRAFGLDAARHVGLFGRYPRKLAIPDRWSSWRPFAVRAARRIIGRQRVDLLWSTFPIATAHAVGRDVARETDIPWIAEFRDPMWQGDYPHDPLVNSAWRSLEADIFGTAARVVVTTPGAKRLYAERFPAFPAANLVVVHNGYDEEVFRRAQSGPATDARRTGGPLQLVHSGVIYPGERDPTHLLAAVSALKRQGRLSSGTLQLVLRASGNDESLGRALRANDIADVVRLEPAVDYLSAIRELLAADGLLLLQGADCNAQIPAKLYEYLRARRPIVALTDPQGDTARMLADSGVGTVAPLNSQAAIECALVDFIDRAQTGRMQQASDETISGYSREELTRRLAALFDGV